MRILIIGGNGLVGAKLISTLQKEEYYVYGTYFQNKVDDESFFPLDITDKTSISKVYKKVKPDAVVLCSAFTNVDACEKDQDKAYRINVDGCQHVAEIAQNNQIKLVYISTDYVFDGIKGNYMEEDVVNPVDYYGKTKLLGEQKVQEICSYYLICRTSVVYGVNKQNFALWLIDQLDNEKDVNIVNDQFVSCTYNVDLADQIIALLNHDKKGVYHTTGAERISRYDFSIKLAETFGFDTSFIHPVSMDDFNWVAKRPADSSLNISKISMVKKPFTVPESLGLFKQEYEEMNSKKIYGVV